MKKETIYDALRIMYQRGDLEGTDLKEFCEWKKSKCNKEEYELKVGK